VAAVLIQIYRRLAKRAAHRGAITDAHIRRKIESDPALEDRFGLLLDLALRVVIKSSASVARKLRFKFLTKS